jgi:translocation and assembly module TamB
VTRRRLAIVGASVLGAVLALALAAVLTLRSDWFREQLRQRIVRVVETATGGRVEVARCDFDWSRLRAEVRGFTLHGLEPADRPPLFHAASIAVGLKIISIFERKVDLASLDVTQPQVHLMLFPDGRTNVPEPKTPKRAGPGAVETILNLAVGRFNLSSGEFEVEGRARTPFDAAGRNLAAKFNYQPRPARYIGQISIEPLRLALAAYEPTDVAVALALTMERNALRIDSARLAAGGSRLNVSGAVEDFNSPRASLKYSADVLQADVARFLRTRLLESGSARAEGEATWAAGAFALKGSVRAENLEYRDSAVRLRGFRAQGQMAAGPGGVDITGLRLSGFYYRPNRQVPVEARIASVAIRGPDLTFHGIAVDGLGGAFRGEGRLDGLNAFDFRGDIAGFEARSVVALYSAAPLPWDARASGSLHLEGALKRDKNLRVEANFAVGPVPGGAPVRGQLTALYDARAGLLDMGRSTLTLPRSRVDFAGAIGRQLRVRLETRDLNELLPAFGETAASAPLELRGGEARFEGMVNGPIETPALTGHLTARRLAYDGKLFDSISADVAASPDNLRASNAAIASGGVRAQFDGAIALSEWKTAPQSAIFGQVSVKAAPAGELAALADWNDAPVQGAVTVSSQFSGTVANPILQADVEIAKGALEDEPFDRFTGHVRYAARAVELSAAQFIAGARQAQLNASYSASPASFSQGRLRFQGNTNSLAIAELVTLQKQRPGAKGTAQASAGGIVDFAPVPKNGRGFRVVELHGSLTGRNLELSGQPLGDLRVNASTEGQTLRVRMQSDFARSSIRGDGSWRLEDDYPGNATVAFSRLDFVRLRAWLSADGGASAPPFAGSAEGELSISGPALRPADWKAQLRIPAFEFGPSDGAPSLVIHNSGPIVASMAESVVTIESAHLTGRYTDLTIAGKASLNQASPLDLRLNGRLDVGLLASFDPDITASGETTANATVRGSFNKPQMGGRMEVKGAAVSLADFPNGLSNASGVILFNGDRATIQNFSGESGGGKIELSGSVSFGGADAVLQLRLAAREVRVRYPEGVSSVSNAALNLTGTTGRSMLTGSVTVLRTGFNPQSDFSSVLASSAEPARTPSTRTGMLGGLSYDIQIQTAPDIRVESEYTQDIGVEARLKLRGTVSNPALLGRVTITQGHVIFFGTRYAVSQGSITFSNPVKVEPMVNVDLETKARGVDVTLTVSGPLKKLNLTPRSDPPLQFNEIVALLATGQTPTSDPTLLNQQSTSPQSWQQMGASALLGQAIASPVAGRLQRFFGVSQLRIDPTLPGVENNPQARITLEQQVTQDITFTYITVVNSSNPQVISVEWDFSRQWSARAVREENGLFGLDFFYKRQFK